MSDIEFRTGLGWDVHRIVPGRPLLLGGVTIPSEFGLDGHSDADILLHALNVGARGGHRARRCHRARGGGTLYRRGPRVGSR